MELQTCKLKAFVFLDSKSVSASGTYWSTVFLMLEYHKRKTKEGKKHGWI